MEELFMNADFLSMIGSLMVFRMILGFFIFLIIIIVIDSWARMRKTKKYRKEISDMYVAGKVRQIAKSEDIDLDEEYKKFKKWWKKEKRDSVASDYDDIVEEELKEKVEEQIESVQSNSDAE